ncbi:hypothetical protein PHYSODRAFT_251118 [Phytophthora sojae]|uniref:Temptin Cys/Cys disulfide domain-containing protein n=1 Tax=Phytophthora sojae (strain P6497) TaxID=1094619 RepID=G4ZPD1_PHYSP|nr:hypothetical protein PHYSODRAFT_251118 [Phytophthora sojae]EGZ15465.1 hypothetical protein PHYSODRAFT_251118 [Phytophthora sojae]|eukprot:XP_009529214.1 hypothetical protein PHYSODRAFT_251118 [Phytophthora sojae]
MKIIIPSLLLLAGLIAFVQELVSHVEASRRFVAMLPNGANVTGYRAIGHPAGMSHSAATNNFGKAFADVGYAWTKELCMNDTDGDGQTNGQELGDPCCQWNMTSNPVVLWTIGVSHPDNASLVSDPQLWANVVCNTSTGTPTMAPNYKPKHHYKPKRHYKPKHNYMPKHRQHHL